MLTYETYGRQLMASSFPLAISKTMRSKEIPRSRNSNWFFSAFQLKIFELAMCALYAHKLELLTFGAPARTLVDVDAFAVVTVNSGPLTRPKI